MTKQMTMTPRAWTLILILGCIWGGSFLSNRITLAEVPVMTAVAIRVTGGALALWVWVRIAGLSLPASRWQIAATLLLGLTNNALPFSLIVWGQQTIDSGLASILNAATAVFTVVLVALVYADEKLTRNRFVGVILGFVGVVTVIGPARLLSFDPSSMAQVAILGSSTSYAVSAVLARRVLKGLRPEVSAALMLTGAAMAMIPLALIYEGPPTLDYSAPVFGALAYLALIATALAYWLYYQILNLAGAGNVSLVTLLVAPVAIVLGAVVYQEALDWHAYVGFVLLALGLMVIDGRLPRKKP